MTEQNQISLPDEVLNTILTGGLDGLPEAVSLLINHAMLIEGHRHLLHPSQPRRRRSRPERSCMHPALAPGVKLFLICDSL